jgi:integrase
MLETSGAMTAIRKSDRDMSKLAQRRDPHTGTVISRTRKGRTVWIMRILMKDGTRKEVTCPYGFNREQAEKRAKEFQTKEDATQGFYNAKARSAGKVVDGELADAWFDRMIPMRAAALKVKDSMKMRSLWSVWISPIIGKLPIASLERSHTLAVRDHLDEAKQTEQIRGKTSMNIWSCFCASMRIACSTKGWAKQLKVLETDITIGVESVDGGPSKRRQWVYPNEFVQLMACEAVPYERRLLYALAAYTGLRPNELAALKFSDCDLGAGVIRVTKAYNYETRLPGLPKTDTAIRDVPIEPALRPALALFLGKPDDLLCPSMQRDRDLAVAWLREDLKKAGVDAKRLWTETETHLQVDFRCLRDTYATWQCIAGLDLHKLMRRMGHTSPLQTTRYAKVAENLDGSVGIPFGPLPWCSTLTSVASSVAPQRNTADTLWSRGGSNP